MVVIEGGDQAGKNTQCVCLAESLRKKNLKVATFTFPDYSTSIGKLIKEYLDHREELSLQTIHCLLSANRWENLHKIERAMCENDILVMDRYRHSNVIYGKLHGLDEGWLRHLDDGLPDADLTILLDIGTDESLRRKKSGRDRFEQEDGSARVFSLYRDLAQELGWEIIDGTNSIHEINRQITEAVMSKYMTAGAKPGPYKKS